MAEILNKILDLSSYVWEMAWVLQPGNSHIGSPRSKPHRPRALELERDANVWYFPVGSEGEIAIDHTLLEFIDNPLQFAGTGVIKFKYGRGGRELSPKNLKSTIGKNGAEIVFTNKSFDETKAEYKKTKDITL